MTQARQQDASSFAGRGRQVIRRRQAHCCGAPLPQPRCQPTILRLPAAVPSTVCSVQTVREQSGHNRAYGSATVSMRPTQHNSWASFSANACCLCNSGSKPISAPGRNSLSVLRCTFLARPAYYHKALTCWVRWGRSWSQSSSFPAASPSPGRGLWRSARCTARLQGWMGEQGRAQGGKAQARLIQMPQGGLHRPAAGCADCKHGRGIY